MQSDVLWCQLIIALFKWVSKTKTSYNSDQSEERLTSSAANEDSKWKQTKLIKRGKTWPNLCVVLHLTDSESDGASFMDQSPSEVTQNQNNSGLHSPSHWLEIALMLTLIWS